MIRTTKLIYPPFLLSVIVLILNDWWFKPVFHNGLTGKLSDFTGLFAFPFFLSALFPAHVRKIHVWTALLFVAWKSELAQPFIDVVNGLGIPIHRTVDYTDNMALLSIVLSFLALRSKINFNLRPVFQIAIIGVCCLTFMATSMARRETRKFVHINRGYRFDFSKRELVSRLNMVQLQEIRKLNKMSGEIDFDSETNAFHYHGQTDTLALILDYEMLKDEDTIVFKTSYAEIKLSGNDSISALILLSAYKTVPQYKDKEYREIVIEEFEKRIIRKIKNYRKEGRIY